MATKKIKPAVIVNIPYSETESVARVAAILQNYGFKEVIAHRTIRGDYPTSKTAMFFCDCSPRELYKVCSHCGERREEIDIKYKKDTVCFFDIQSKLPDFCKKIFVNGALAGTFCPKHLLLVARDWSHSDINLPLVKKIIKKMENKSWIEKRKMKKKNIPYVPTLGCDPEFEGILNGNIVFASDYTSSICSIVGADGAGSQVELRPEPSSNVQEVVKNIREAISIASETYDNLVVKGDKYPLGGHIHIGLPSCGDISQFLRLLDDFIGKPLLKTQGEAREDSGYGNLGDYRVTPYGIEYRVPPSTWVASPKFARVVLKAVKNLATSWVKRKRAIVYNYPPQEKDYKRLCGFTDKDIKIWKELLERKFEPAIYAAWRIKPKKKSLVVFSDEWLDIIKYDILRMVKRKRKVRKVKLFGLGKYRGEVIAIRRKKVPEGYNRIDHPYLNDSEYDIVIGLPYSFRIEGKNRKEIIDWLRKVI